MVVYENSLNRLDKEDWRQTSEDHAAVQSWCHARDLHSIVLMLSRKCMMTWILFQLDRCADQGQGVMTKLG